MSILNSELNTSLKNPYLKASSSFQDKAQVKRPDGRFSQAQPQGNLMRHVDNLSDKKQVTLYDRNKILSNGTYKQAQNELQYLLLPVMDSLQKLFAKPAKGSTDFSFRPNIEGKIGNIAQFDALLSETKRNIARKSFTKKDLTNLNLIIKILKNTSQRQKDSREATHFKQTINDLEKYFHTSILNNPDKKIQFVLNVFQGIDTIERLENTINLLQRSPLNKNEDLRLLSKQLSSAVRNIHQAGSNIAAYAQQNNFNEKELNNHIAKLPLYMQEFSQLLAQVGDKPQVQNNQEYVDLISDLYTDTLSMLQHFAPELEEMMLQEQQKPSDMLLKDTPLNKAPDMAEFAKNTQNIQKSKGTMNGANSPFLRPAPLGDYPHDHNKMDQYGDLKPIEQIEYGNVKDIYDHPIKNVAYNSQNQHQALMKSDLKYGKQPDNMPPNYAMNKAYNMQNLLQDLPNGKTSYQPLSEQKSALKENSHLSSINADNQIDSLQELWQKAHQTRNMKNQINAVNEIGQNLEDMAMAGSGRPNPEMIALAKRGKRLNSLQNLMDEVPKVNKATQDLEKSALEAQHAYMTGVNQIATQRLKNDIDGAHMQSEQQKIYAKGLEKLGTDGLEIATNMAKNYEKIIGLFNQIIEMRINNTWDSIKRLARGFKF